MVDPRQRAIPFPQTQIFMHRAPRRQILGQSPPLAASHQHIEHAVQNLADIDRDGRINGADIAVLLGSWGACGDCPADITGDGNVGGDDLSQILGGWAP